MESTNYKPNGNIQGDTKSMRDAGHSTGVTDTYGADLSGDACNCQGSLGGAAKSDSMSKTDCINPIIGSK